MHHRIIDDRLLQGRINSLFAEIVFMAIGDPGLHNRPYRRAPEKG